MLVTAAQRVLCALIGLGAFLSGVRVLEGSPSLMPLAGVAAAMGWGAVATGVICVLVAVFWCRTRG